MKNSLRVSVIGPSARFLSGISYYTIRLSNALSLHADVTAILFRHMLPRRLFPGWKRVGKNLSSTKFENSVHVLEILDWYNPFSWVYAAIHARKSDVLILQWWTASVSHMYLAIQLLTVRRMTMIMEFHEVIDPLENSIFPLRVYGKLMGSMVRKFSDAYVVHSEVDRELISQKYSIDKKRITIIPHGLYDQYPRLDKSTAREKLGLKEENVILFFGLLRPYKGVKHLIRAFENLPEHILLKSRLLIVGEAWEDHESVDAASQSPVKDNITLIPRYISDEEILLFFSAADVMVLPYNRASQSGVAHIAMSVGIPIIASRVGGLEESLSKYGGTIFIAPSDEQELCKRIEEVYNNKKLYQPPIDLRWETISEKWVSFITHIRNTN
jgi:glycosyltransferase involved in cell wall biosynthesis